MYEVIWKAQQMDDMIQQLYQSIKESAEITIKATSKFTILGNKVFIVVNVHLIPSIRCIILHLCIHSF